MLSLKSIFLVTESEGNFLMAKTFTNSFVAQWILAQTVCCSSICPGIIFPDTRLATCGVLAESSAKWRNNRCQTVYNVCRYSYQSEVESCNVKSICQIFKSCYPEKNDNECRMFKRTFFFLMKQSCVLFHKCGQSLFCSDILKVFHC